MIKTTTKDARQSLLALSDLDSRAVTMGAAMGNVPYQYSSATTLKILGLRMALSDAVKTAGVDPENGAPVGIEVQCDSLNIKELNMGANSPQNNIPPSVLHRLVSLNLLTLKSD